MTSEYGKFALEYLRKNDIKIYKNYIAPTGDFAETTADKVLLPNGKRAIIIHMTNIQDAKYLSGVLVHEVEHFVINKPNSIMQEFQCYKKQALHMGWDWSDEKILTFIREQKVYAGLSNE